MADALRAAWIKLQTLSSTGWLLLAAVPAAVAVSAAAVSATSCARGMACAGDPAKLSLTGIQFDLAVLPISNEYSTGMIRVTLTAMPRRDHVLAARAALVAGLVLAVGVAGAGGSVLAGG